MIVIFYFTINIYELIKYVVDENKYLYFRHL